MQLSLEYFTFTNSVKYNLKDLKNIKQNLDTSVSSGAGSSSDPL